MSTTAPKHPASPNVDEPQAKRTEIGKGAQEEVKMEHEPTGVQTQQPDVEMAEAQKLERAARESKEVVPPSGQHLGDIKRMWEKHEEYVMSQRLLAKLPELFPAYDEREAKEMIVWLAQLPVAMHRPRPAVTEGWKAAGEVMTVQWDEKLPSIFQKMVTNNISCVPVLDNRRRYMGLLDNQSLVIHALHAFGILDPSERAATLQQLTAASAGISVPITSKVDAEMKMEEAAAAGPQEGAQAIRSMAPPVHVKGGGKEFAGRPIWSASKGGDKGDWGERWERRSFQEARACDLLAEEVPTLGGSSTSQVVVSEVQLPAPSVEILAPPLQQGSSTLFAVELMARMGLHRVPILNADRFLTGLVTQSMLISLISQYRAKIPSFQSMPVSNMIQFLAPHRLVKVDEDVVTAQAFHVFVHERVTGGAVVNKDGVLVDVLSSRDLRGIGRRGQDFEMLWSIVREFKEHVRKQFPDKTPASVNYVTQDEKMVDVLSKMNDGNLHRVFLCEMKNGLPHPVATITQRDVARILLIYLGLTLQGEVRVAMA